MILTMSTIVNQGSTNNRSTTPSHCTNTIITPVPTQSNPSAASSSSIRLLAGSHISSATSSGLNTTVAASAAAGLNGHAASSASSSSSTSSGYTSGSPPNPQNNPNNLAYFQANPHLTNAAVIHSSAFTQPIATNSQNTQFQKVYNKFHCIIDIYKEKLLKNILFKNFEENIIKYK